MNMLTKVFAVTNAVFAVIFLSVVFTLWSKETLWVKATQDVIGRYNRVVQEYLQTKTEQEREIADLKLAREGLAANLQSEKNNVERLTAEVANLSKESADLKEQRDNANDISRRQTGLAESFKKDLDEANAEIKKVTAERDLANRNAEIATSTQIDVAKELVNKDDQIRVLMAEITKLRVDLNERMNAGREEGAGRPGVIPAVNIVARVARTDGQVVVLTAGQRHGVVPGMQFMVTNEADGWLGRVQVRNVDADYSVADILPVTKDPAKIAIGDKVSAGV